MDNSKGISESILGSSDASSSSSLSSNTNLSSSSESSGFFDTLKNINMTTWLIIILILAFLGFNIFVYLAKGTQDISNFFGNFFEKIFGTTVAVASEITDTSAEGAKKVVTGTANVVNTGLNTVQNVTPNPKTAQTSVSSQPVTNPPPVDIAETNTLNKALNSAQQTKSSPSYESDSASSSIQGGGKSGWCYIGEDRGIRTCATVGSDDICMSGEIFPSQELCVNPSLRA
jgi:hypothetical protein